MRIRNCVMTCLAMLALFSGSSCATGLDSLTSPMLNNRFQSEEMTNQTLRQDLSISRGTAQYDNIFEAATKGTALDIALLIRAGADANARDGRGMTPLMNAIVYNKTAGKDVIAALIWGGADVNVRLEAGNVTPLMLAAGYNNSPEVIAALLEAGADVNSETQEGATPLILAAGRSKSAEVISALIEAGADIKARDKNGWTPLLAAAAYTESEEIVSTLVKAGADVNTRTRGGLTPLMFAAIFNKSTDVTKALLQAGADVNAQAEDGSTALSLAEYQDNSETIKILK